MPAASGEVGRRLPQGSEIYLDHIAHFVRDAEAASRAFQHCGFTTTPIAIQANDTADGAQPAGTGNVTAMFDRGYAEVLFKTSDTPLGRELDAALDRHAGLHLVAFAVADAAAAHRRLAAAGFRMRDLVHLRRPVDTEAGADTASFTVARVDQGAMAEGRIQILTHHTEQALWQKRWLRHANGVTGLAEVIIAVADVNEAAERFARFTGRAAVRTPGGAVLALDRGGVYLVSHDRATEKLPEVAFATAPFILGYALTVRSLAETEAVVDRAGLEWRALDAGIVAVFPRELGQGAWFFVEQASALPWRQGL